MALSPTAYWRGIVDTKLIEHGDLIDEHGLRLTALEKFMWKLIGIAAIGSFVGAALASVVAVLILTAIGHHT